MPLSKSLPKFGWIPLLATATAFAQPVTLTTYPNPSSFGQFVTLTAAVAGGASGRVTFTDGTAGLGVAVIANGQAVFKVPFLLPGPHSLKARYDGDSTHQAAASPPVTQTVNPSTTLGFAAPIASPYPFTCMVGGDFNGDGIADVASDAAILLGNGDGAFRAMPAVNASCPMLAGDFNDDGITDLASTNGNLFFGKGDGTFQQVAAPALNGAALATADFNGDGIADLAVGNATSVTVLLGNGDGTFTRKAGYTVPSTVTAIAAGDWNGDGVPDLAVFQGSSLSVFLGNGDGSLQTPLSSTPNTPLANIAMVADLNGDGRPDIATSGNSGRLVQLRATHSAHRTAVRVTRRE